MVVEFDIRNRAWDVLWKLRLRAPGLRLEWLCCNFFVCNVGRFVSQFGFGRVGFGFRLRSNPLADAWVVRRMLGVGCWVLAGGRRGRIGFGGLIWLLVWGNPSDMDRMWRGGF